MRSRPAELRIGLLLFGVSLSMYLATLCWAPCPGLPTQALLTQLGAGGEGPCALDWIWGAVVRGMARLPGGAVSGWAGVFGAACGAACVGLTGMLMTRVSYRGGKGLTATSMGREVRARELSGGVAGLFLACSIPFWLVSTRSLPGSFHVLFLLVAAWLLSEYQQGGKWRHLILLGGICGVGMAEFATVIVFFPMAAFLVAREMYRRGELRAGRAHFSFIGGLLGGGGAAYGLAAWLLVRRGGAGAVGQALARILQEQAQLIVQVRFSPGVLIVLLFAMVPWLMLFAMSRRSPWYYEGDQVAVRVLIVAGLLAVLYDAPFAPWRLLGMDYLMVTPYLLMAICAGYMAGEFWIMGESQMSSDASGPKRIARRVSGAFAALMPGLVLLGGACNWRAVDGRHGGDLRAAAMDILERLGGRDIVFASGFLDDSLALALWERESPVRLIRAGRIASPRYLRQLAGAFEEAPLREALENNQFNGFVEGLFGSGGGAGRVAIVDVHDALREFGDLVPDGLLYRLEPPGAPVDLAALVEAQRPFWAWMERLAAHRAPRGNPAHGAQELLLQLASKMINNFGVMQAERGDAGGALETLRVARRVGPENLSVLLNLMELGGGRDLPEAAEWEEDWKSRQERMEPFRWALAGRYGYVWNAREWARRGWIWALSGAPAADEGSRRVSSAPDAGAIEREGFLKLAHLSLGRPVSDEHECRARLLQDEKDVDALMTLGWHALRRGDPEIAEVYRKAAVAAGLPEESTRFDQALALRIGGDRGGAVAALEELSRVSPNDVRIWVALALLADEGASGRVRALKKLRDLRPDDVGARLSMAEIQMRRLRFAEAQAELDAAVQLDSKSEKTWEMMTTLARARGHTKLVDNSLRTLLALNPAHPFQRLQKGEEWAGRGDWAAAEAELREGLRGERHAELLGALAETLLQGGGDLREARELLDEAVCRQPYHPRYRRVRGELNLKEGNVDEAERDLRQALEAMPGDVPALMGLVRAQAARGEREAALNGAEALLRRGGDLSPEQRAQVEEWAGRMRGP